MKTVKIGRHTVDIFDDIETMPVVRYQKFNQYLVLATGIGNDISAIKEKLSSIMRLMNSDVKKASKEVENLYQTFYFIQYNIDPMSLAYGILIGAIDGEPCDDLSEDGVKKTLAKLEELTHGDMVATVLMVKKKLIRRLKRASRRLTAPFRNKSKDCGQLKNE